MSLSTDSKAAYKAAGVDLDKANDVVEIAKRAASIAKRPDIAVGMIGGFSGGFKIPKGYDSPVILAATDGVGTKLELAQQLNKPDGLGIDLVAMSVNDILTQGGEPLAFLDYFATDAIDAPTFERILTSIARGCKESNCALVGGETAEMPGFYAPKQYDLAGFAVGVVDEAKILPRTDAMQAGDVLLGVASSGPHANGYSLIRKILKDNAVIEDVSLDINASLFDALMAPTRLYVQPVLELLKTHNPSIKGMVHVTGGGFQDNLPRVLPEHLNVNVDLNGWRLPKVFAWLANQGQLDGLSVLNTFNCGVGFVLVVEASKAESVRRALRDILGGEEVYTIGRLQEKSASDDSRVYFDGLETFL
jgi:phosphoribosylformylglycinamidine cyclo-ligase